MEMTNCNRNITEENYYEFYKQLTELTVKNAKLSAKMSQNKLNEDLQTLHRQMEQLAAAAETIKIACNAIITHQDKIVERIENAGEYLHIHPDSHKKLQYLISNGLNERTKTAMFAEEQGNIPKFDLKTHHFNCKATATRANNAKSSLQAIKDILVNVKQLEDVQESNTQIEGATVQNSDLLRPDVLDSSCLTSFQENSLVASSPMPANVK